MRIISGQRDYYDCIQGHGQDLTLHYIRTERTERLKSWPFPGDYDLHYNSGTGFSAGDKRVVYRTHLIGFCGKVYASVELQAESGAHKAFAYYVDEADEFVRAHWNKKLFDSYSSKNPRTRPYVPFRRRHLQDVFAAVKPDGYAELFDRLKCPIFVVSTTLESYLYRYGDIDVICNPLLKPFEFYRIVEPYTAYQGLSMYLGGLATPQKPIPQWDDATKIHAAGFDTKTSFRKPPSKR